MIWSKLTQLADRASLLPDLSRATRATVGFMAPVLLAATGWIAFDVSFVAIAAQNIAMVDARGDYRVRLALLVMMAAVFAGAAALGATVADNLTVAILATGLLAVCGGVWRHLSADYGPPLAIASTLVFLLALAAPGASSAIGTHALAALAGGAWGVLVQVANWPFRPQHALRRTVADSWLAVADLFDALVPGGEAAARHERLSQAEAAARATLDHTYAALAVARAGLLRPRLEALHLAGARLATRVVALQTAIEAALDAPALADLAPALEPALASVSNLSRHVALTTVSHQPGHLATFEVRTRRLGSLLGVLRARLGPAPARAQLVEIVRQIEHLLPEIREALHAVVDRAAERTAAPLDLTDLRTVALRPLASALNLTLAIDPALVRYTLRLAALTMTGVALYRLYGFPHGYWLPFTVVVVLQPDYGSTRQRAGQRVAGTLAGSVLASGVLWLDLPAPALWAAMAVTMFGFGYHLKRNYGLAIFFITLFIVFITEAHEPVTLAFTLERLASTLAGGALALLAAHLFWPVWERDRLPGILAQTFRVNRDYLAALLDRLEAGGSFDRDAIVIKRRAEAATSAAFSSLRRLGGDPRNRQEGIEHAATLVNGNQRLTRILNVLALHLAPGAAVPATVLAPFRSAALQALESLAASERGLPPPGQLEPLLAALERPLFPAAATDRERWIYDQLARAATELAALLLALQAATPPWDEHRTP